MRNKKCKFRTKQIRSRRLKKCRNYRRLIYKSMLVVDVYETTMYRDNLGNLMKFMSDQVKSYSGEDYRVAESRYNDIRSNIPPKFEIEYMRNVLDKQVNGEICINLTPIGDDLRSYMVEITRKGESVVIDMKNLLDGFTMTPGRYSSPMDMCEKLYNYNIYIGKSIA